MVLFDTDVVSAVMRGPAAALVRRVTAVPVGEQAVSAVTVGEIVYGARRLPDPQPLLRRFGQAIGHMRVLPFDEKAAWRYGELRAELEGTGHRLAEPDLRIAAIALAREALLVTANVRHFARVLGLEVQNWLSP